MNQPPVPIGDIRNRLRERPEQVLAEEFAIHRSRLCRIVQFRLDPALAGRIEPDDVLQEAWLAARQRLDYFLGQSDMPMFVWLRLIVGQTLIDLHRFHLKAKMRDAFREVSGRSLHPSPSTSVSLVSQLLARVSTPSMPMLRAEMAEELRKAIDGMDPIDREVLALRHFEELSNQETAQVLGIEVKAASIRYVRALQRLKRILQDLPGFQEEPHVGD